MRFYLNFIDYRVAAFILDNEIIYIGVGAFLSKFEATISL
jgi:hypothetical protein